MNRLKLPSLLVTAILVAAIAVADDTAPKRGIRDNTPDVHAFTGATVVVSPGKSIANATLVVRDGLVAAVGAGVAIPKDAVVHDASGLTIYPGFVDPYAQYGVEAVESTRAPGRAAPVYAGTRAGGNAWNDAIHAESNWGETFKPDPKAAAKLMGLGYTAVQSTRLDGIFRGRGFVASLGEGTPNETLIAPASRHFLSFDKGSSKQAYPSSLMGSIALMRQTFHDAAWYAKASAAGEADVNTALAALASYDGPFLVDARDELTLLRASRVAAETGRPMIYLGTHREGNRIDEIAALKSTIILPASLPRRPDILRPGDEHEVTLGQLRLWERAPETAALLESRGVPFAFTAWQLGSEEDFFVNIRDMVKAGLSKDGALAALTTVPARIAGVEREVGTIENGRRANFVIASGDLFDDGRIDAVWIDGRLAHRPDPDFRGTFETKIDGRDAKLELSGTKSRLKAGLSIGETSTEKADVLLAERAGIFSLDLTPVGVDGTGWFRLEATEKAPSLHYTSPGGAASALALTPVEKEKKEKAAEASISRRTMPNIAFGWESLPKAESVLVRNATIWTSDAAGILEGADMLVANGKIAKIGKGLEAPKGARVVDAAGKHVTPGIIDEHSHLAISAGVNEGTHASTAEVRIGDVVNPDDVGVYRALAGGVTAAQLLHGSSNPIGGQAQIIRFKWGASSEELKFEGAPPSIKFALGENVKQSNWGEQFTTRYPQTRMGVETFIRDRFLAAREYSAEWKAWNALAKDKRAKTAPPRRDLELETLVEILESKRFIHCHSYVQSEILMLMRLAEELGFRVGTFTHILEGYKVASEMREHGAGAAGFSDWWAYKAEVWDAIPYSPCLTHEKGVVTALNSDSANTIRRLNQEAGKMVMYCGLDQAEALKMVTIHPAKLLMIDDRVGSLVEGKDADFVIWNGNPLSMTSRVEQTWIEGTNYFDVERDAAMRTRDAEEKAALVAKALRSTDKRGGAPPEASQIETWHCEDLGGHTDAR